MQTPDQHDSEERAPPIQPLFCMQPDRDRPHQECAGNGGARLSNDGAVLQGTDGLSLAHNFKARKGLGIVHINARSLLPKMDILRFWVSNADPDIIVVSESWLNSNVSDSDVNVFGYSVFRADRVRRGGGVAIFNPGKPKLVKPKKLLSKS